MIYQFCPNNKHCTVNVFFFFILFIGQFFTDTLSGFFYTLVLYDCSSCSLITGLLIDDVYTRLIWVVYFSFFSDNPLNTVTDTVYENSLLGFGIGSALAWRAPVSQLCSTAVRLLYSRASCGRLSGCRCSPFLWRELVAFVVNDNGSNGRY